MPGLARLTGQLVRARAVRSRSIRVALTGLPNDALAEIARYLPLRTAIAVAGTCRRLRLAFPSALVRCASPGKLEVRARSPGQFDAWVFPWVLEWMRVYEFRLVVRREDLAQLLCALAERRAPWARLVFPKLHTGDYVDLWRVVRRLRPSAPATFEWDAEGAPTDAATFDFRFRSEYDMEDVDDEELERMRQIRINAFNRFRTNVTDECMALLGDVHTLDMYGTRVGDVGAAYLSNLHTLRLGGTTLTDAGVVHLTKLHTLELHETSVTDAGVAHLSSLHTLRLNGSRRVTDAGVAHLTNLHTLGLQLTRVTDAGVAHLTNLHTLDLSDTLVTDAGVAHLTNLHTLDLSETRVTDAGVAHLTNLHTLNLSDTQVTDAGVAKLSRLHALDLRGTKVTGAVTNALRGVAELRLPV